MVLVPYIDYHINNYIGSSNIGDSDNSNISKGGIDNRNCSYSLCLFLQVTKVLFLVLIIFMENLVMVLYIVGVLRVVVTVKVVMVPAVVDDKK